MDSSTAALLFDVRAKNRVFRKACSQVILLNLRIEDAKTHYLRARATGNLAFRYSYRMKLTSLEGVRDTLYNFAVVKCEEIEGLQERLREALGGYFYLSGDEDSSDEDWAVIMTYLLGSSKSHPPFQRDNIQAVITALSMIIWLVSHSQSHSYLHFAIICTHSWFISINNQIWMK